MMSESPLRIDLRELRKESYKNSLLLAKIAEKVEHLPTTGMIDEKISNAFSVHTSMCHRKRTWNWSLFLKIILSIVGIVAAGIGVKVGM